MDSRIRHEKAQGEKIASLADQVWNWNTPAGQLRFQRRVELICSQIQPGMEVLELGCGTGNLTKELVHHAEKVTAMDISPHLLEKAKTKVSGKNVQFIEDNAYACQLESARFDYIVGISVLHHLDIEKAFSEIVRLLKPQGKIFFSEPNLMNPQIAVQKNVPFFKKKLGDTPNETAFFR